MIPKTPVRTLLLTHLMSITLSACGGGSDGSPSGAAGTGASGGGANQGGTAAGPVGGASAGQANVAGATALAGTSSGGSPGGAGAGSGGGAGPSGGGGLGGGAGTASGGVSGSAQTGGAAGAAGQPSTPGGRSISFGTLLDASTVMSAASTLAKAQASSGSAQWRAKGDQHRTYRFQDAGGDQPYRLYVPTNWDGSASLPLAMFLHGSGSNENTYVDQNNQQLIKLAEQHGYLLVAPLGVSGAYGNFLRLSAPFGDEAGAAELMAAVTTQTERTNQLSEQDVINVLELVLNEYPIDRKSLFLFGHSMGSGGTWYIGGKYASYFRGLAPMSGPFVQEHGYPWSDVKGLALFVTEGTQTPSVDASKLLADWLSKNGFNSQYREVNADHGGMIPLVLPDVFKFFDAARGK